jgi:hypothetical protein
MDTDRECGFSREEHMRKFNEHQKLSLLLDRYLQDKDFKSTLPVELSTVLYSTKVVDLVIPISRLREIYRARAKLNERNGSPIKGFEVLLGNLNTTAAKEGLVNEMSDKEGTVYVIFSDPECKELIGILKLPQGRSIGKTIKTFFP